MAVFRVERNTGYTVMSNHHLRNKELSLKAKGLLNQVAVHANTYGIYPSEIAALQKDYADLWEPLSELLKKLSAVVSL